MLKSNQRTTRTQSGFAHIGLFAVVVIVAVVGFAGYRVANNSNSSSNSQSSTDKVNTTDSIKGGGDELGGLDEKELENNKVIENNDKTPTTYGDGDPGVKFVNFTKGGGNLVNNESVNVTLVADTELSGSCKWLFILGNSSVAAETSSTKTKECSVKVPLSKFPKSGNWYVTVAYDSTDGKYTGVGGGFPIEVVPTITTANFTKGGWNYDSNTGDLYVKLTMDQTASGTCTYTFSLNGTVRFERTSDQKGDNFCETTIVPPSFPKSGLYNMVVSFVSNDGFTQGTTSGDVSVN